MKRLRECMKPAVYVSVLLLLCTCLAACRASTVDPIAELNETLVAPFLLTAPEDDVVCGSEYNRIEGYGCYGFEKEGIRITISGWPDVLDPYHLTRYDITSGEYGVFGFTIGDSYDDVIAALKAHHYKRRDYRAIWADYTKGDTVAIQVFFNDERYLREIRIEVIPTNVEGVEF